MCSEAFLTSYAARIARLSLTLEATGRSSRQCYHLRKSMTCRIGGCGVLLTSYLFLRSEVNVSSVLPTKGEVRVVRSSHTTAGRAKLVADSCK
jgi:hypothetical protein